MLRYSLFLLSFFLIFGFVQCKNGNPAKKSLISKNEIQYAKGFTIENFSGYSILKVSNPWPNANQSFTYILKQKNGIVPDSLKKNTIIPIPIKSIIVTSTTHIPSLEMLGVEHSLVGFPHLDYISSPKVRTLIEAGSIKELGNNHDLNTETIIDLDPSVIIGYGLDNNNPALDNLSKRGLKIVFNGDWNEQTPLGKAEWIKLFGALYGKQKQAHDLFSQIEKEYLKTKQIAKSALKKPTILAGDIFEDKWYLPSGTSWGSLFLKEAQGNYLWGDTKGTGSLALSFETVFLKAKNADFWITSGQFSSLAEMTAANPHYIQFKAFQNKKVYSFNAKKGKTGGILYYELAPNRPDIVLKDILKILHPELMPEYHLFFFKPLQ